MEPPEVSEGEREKDDRVRDEPDAQEEIEQSVEKPGQEKRAPEGRSALEGVRSRANELIAHDAAERNVRERGDEKPEKEHDGEGIEVETLEQTEEVQGVLDEGEADAGSDAQLDPIHHLIKLGRLLHDEPQQQPPHRLLRQRDDAERDGKGEKKLPRPLQGEEVGEKCAGGDDGEPLGQLIGAPLEEERRKDRKHPRDEKAGHDQSGNRRPALPQVVDPEQDRDRQHREQGREDDDRNVVLERRDRGHGNAEANHQEHSTTSVPAACYPCAMNAPKARALLPPGTPRERIILALWWFGLLFLLLRGNTVFENVATLFAALWAAFLLLLTLLWLPETALALPRRLLKSLAVVTIVAILSMLSTVNPDASVWELARLLSFVSILLAIPPLVREPARWRWAVKSLLILLAAVTLGSLAWYLRAGPPSASHQLLGPFSWYNQMGGFLVMSLPLFLGASASARSPSGRWMFLFLTIAGLLSLLFTFSRGSWLTGIVTVPLALWALRLPRRRIASLLLGALIVGLLAGQRNPGLITDLAARARSVAQEWSSEARTTSGGIRGDAVLVARKALRERFLLGTGPGTFEDAFLRFQRAPWRFAAHAHNEALEMFVELGIAGGAAFALFFSTLR